MNAPRALGQAGRWAVVVDAMLAVLLAAVAWPFSRAAPLRCGRAGQPDPDVTAYGPRLMLLLTGTSSSPPRAA